MSAAINFNYIKPLRPICVFSNAISKWNVAHIKTRHSLLEFCEGKQTTLDLKP